MNRSKIGTGQNHDWAYYSLHPVPMGLPGRRSYAGYGENILLWRKEVENPVGSLARALEPVTKAGANLHVLEGVSLSGRRNKGRN